VTLRVRLFLALLAALLLLYLPLAALTAREATDAATSALTRAALLRLGFVREEGATMRDLVALAQEFGGVGLIIDHDAVAWSDAATHTPPDGLLSALARGESFVESSGGMLWVALPTESGGVGLAASLGEVAELPGRLVGVYLAGGAGLLLLAWAVGAFFLSRAVEPMASLARAVSARGPDRLEPLTLPRLPELVPAVEALNRLMSDFGVALERLKIQEESARRFAYGASHELRNPLAALRGYLDVLARQPAEIRAQAGALREAERMERVLNGLLALARLEGRGLVTGEPLDLAGLASERFGITVTGATLVRADPALAALALENLIENARRHGGGVDNVTFEPDRDGVWITVHDRGEGLDAGLLERAFEPFVRGGSGTGLGLALVAAVAQAHGGQVRAANRPGGGASIGFRLPSA
jgi:two-component system sensor histidine kinase TctE